MKNSKVNFAARSNNDIMIIVLTVKKIMVCTPPPPLSKMRGGDKNFGKKCWEGSENFDFGEWLCYGGSIFPGGSNNVLGTRKIAHSHYTKFLVFPLSFKH